MKLQDLIDEVARNWPFDEANYPGTEKLSEDEKKLAAIRHVFLHQVEAIGNLAEVIKQAEYGKGTDRKKLHTVVHKLFKNNLMLAQLARVGSEDILRQLIPSRFAHETPTAPVA